MDAEEPSFYSDNKKCGTNERSPLKVNEIKMLPASHKIVIKRDLRMKTLNLLNGTPPKVSIRMDLSHNPGPVDVCAR